LDSGEMVEGQRLQSNAATFQSDGFWVNHGCSESGNYSYSNALALGQ
jgi:hypothetical protein